MTLPQKTALVGILLLCAFYASEALHEDEVGVWDWHQQYVGKTEHAVFQTQGSGRKRVVVASKYALACLNLRSGELSFSESNGLVVHPGQQACLVPLDPDSDLEQMSMQMEHLCANHWRRVLGANDSVDALELIGGKYVVSLSRGGGIVRAWHLPDGALVWESFLKKSSSASLQSSLLFLTVDINHDKVNDILVWGGNVLHALSSIDGSILWKTDLHLHRDDVMLDRISLNADGVLLGIGVSITSGLCTVEINVRSGDIQKITSFARSTVLDASHIAVVSGVAVVLDLSSNSVFTSVLGTDADANVKQIADLFNSDTGDVQLLQTKLEGAVVFKVNEKLVVVKVDKETGVLSVLEVLEGPAILSGSLQVIEDKHAVAILQADEDSRDSGKYKFRVVYANDWDTSAVKESVKVDVQRGSITKVFLNAYLRVDRTYGFRALVVGEDHSLSLLQQGEVVWTREDGLASIIDTWTSELPLDRDRNPVSEVEHSLADWLRGHWLKLKASLFLASPDELAAVQALRLHSSEKTKTVRDHNGFRRLLIVLTEAGKVLALHSGDGRIVWSLLLPGFRTESGGVKVPLRLLPWQVPHQHALDENPVVLVLGKVEARGDSAGVASWVDVHQGKELRSLQLKFPVKLVFPLPITDSSEQRLHLFVDDQSNVHLFPATDESLSLFMKHKSDVFFYVLDKDEGTIVGYAIKCSTDGTSYQDKDGLVFQTYPIWSVKFPPESEVISTFVSRNPDEAVHTQSKVLGNRDVLFKYLNKNTIFVATVTPKAAHHIGDATPEEAGMVAYLIDTVTGRILHRVTHPFAQGPVHAVFNENWVVYHYFNLKAYRYEMSVLEIYDQNRLGDKGVLPVMLGRHNATAAMSSFSAPSVEVKAQTYYFAFSVKAISVTSTARGITGKHVLVGTVGDQVLALDKRFFDSRRTANPSPAEREEGIIPLTDAIPVVPQSYMTHSHQVEGLRGIVTVPARLESTCLVFAYGLDLFYTRTAPSRTYDSLTEDFSYALLLITIIALVVGILVTWVLSERKELGEKWK